MKMTKYIINSVGPWKGKNSNQNTFREMACSNKNVRVSINTGVSWMPLYGCLYIRMNCFQLLYVSTFHPLIKKYVLVTEIKTKIHIKNRTGTLSVSMPVKNSSISIRVWKNMRERQRERKREHWGAATGSGLRLSQDTFLPLWMLLWVSVLLIGWFSPAGGIKERENTQDIRGCSGHDYTAAGWMDGCLSQNI